MSQRENLQGINNGFGPESPLDYAFAVVDEAKPPISKCGRQLLVGPSQEIGVGEKRIIEVEGLSIGVYNIRGEFFAIKNICPHAGAPLCQGHIQTTHRPAAVGEFDPALEGRILRCPWHGWEFDIVTGKGLYDAHSRVATYKVSLDEEGNLILNL